jgi:hypothetical protein
MIENMTAVRAYNKVWGPLARSMSEAEECDAHFDGGEWSGPAWGRIWEEQEDRVRKLVAERFGITPQQLEQSVREADYQFDVNFFGLEKTAPTCTDPVMHARYAERGIEDQCGSCLMKSDPGRLQD